MTLSFSRLACLVVFAVIALAACSSGPGVAAPTVKDGAGKVLASTLPLKVDETSKPGSLSGVFTGASLEYSAVSSDETVATAAIANGALTITAHKAGPATITVTAKNAGGSAKYEVKVTVTSKPNGTGTGAAPTVKPGARRTVEFEAGDTTETVTLISVFTGENLTYAVTSNNSTVADGRIRNAVLTITALSTGSATITVTATNAGGNRAHSITVTVPEPGEDTTPDPPVTPTITNPSDCPATLPKVGVMYKVTLEITRELRGRCTLPAGHSLIYDYNEDLDTSMNKKVSVGAPDGNVWTITALKKGIAVIYIHNDQAGKTAGTITVMVPNTPPQLKSMPAASTANLIPDSEYETISVNPGASFQDPDIADDPDGLGTSQGSYRFKVHDKPDGVVIDTDRGFVAVSEATGGEFNSDLTDGAVFMNAVILKNPNPGISKTFDILLHAYDRDNDQSDNPVKLTFPAQDPQEGDYTVGQSGNGKVATIAGFEKALRIGNRLDVPHEITVTGDAFTVATEKIADLVSGKVRVNPDSPPDGAGELCNADFSIPKWSSSTALGEECYSIASSSASILKITGFSVTDNMITFQLPSKNRSVSATGKPVITITYHVWALSSGIDRTTDPFPTTGRTRVTAAMKIPVDIHRCTETSDCPLVAE